MALTGKLYLLALVGLAVGCGDGVGAFDEAESPADQQGWEQVTTTPLPLGQVQVLSGQRLARLYYTVDVTAPSRLRVTLSGGSGNPDLYVRAGQIPNLTSYDCGSKRPSTEEVCELPVVPGRYFIMVRATAAFSNTGLLGVLETTGDDVTPPQAAVLSPSAGATARGWLRVVMEATDNVGVARVAVQLDGAEVAALTSPPWRASVSLAGVSSGQHSVTARALDAAGNATVSAPVSIAVGASAGTLSQHLNFGLPDDSATALDHPNNYLLVKPEYVISYNSSRRTPKWVAWKTDRSFLGPIPRQDNYRQDGQLPSALPQASQADYKNSTWTRGHLCPSEDRTATVASNSATFLLTNMVPQADNNNGGPWKNLEDELVRLARGGKTLYVYAGPIFTIPYQTIGRGVAVPSSVWKVVVALNPGETAVTDSSRVVAVIMPNAKDIPRTAPWRNYRATVRDIESQTGLDLFSEVDPGVQDVVETRLDTQ